MSERYYIRFGEIPKDEISHVWFRGIHVGQEIGVSVYHGIEIDGIWHVVFPNPSNPNTIDDLQTYVEVAKTLDGSILQIEGNINSRNDTQAGQQLSYERANAVAKYFISCGIDPNRLVVVGNGNHNMLVDPGAADATLNRRTDVFFKILEE